nr:retrovirus-related Pol polyprotein from transposon TNT 1-94 [Tanacetum cinerariifolium]
MWKPKSPTGNVNPNLVEIILFIVDSGCSKHMTGNLKILINFVEKFLGTIKFRNDQIAPILGYGDLVQGAVTIKRVYYVEGLNHNLFSVGQFCDVDLEVAFRNSKRRLHLLHMDLCGPMRVASMNGKRYVLVIVDDYSRYTWTHFLRSKDEKPKVLIEFIRIIQRGLQAQVRVVRTDKGTEFLYQTLHAYFAAEGIQHQTSVARTPEQNGVVERRNRTLVEAARTMLSAAKVPLFFWAEAIATACFTQNRSLVIPRHEKTPYHIINERKPSVKFFHIFGSVWYIVRDGENLDKMKEKGDECIFVGYSTQSRAYRVFNKRTRVIMESIHVNFDELPQMASVHNSSDPAPTCQKMASVLIPLLNVRQCVSFSTGVISTTSVSRPQLKSNPQGDRVLRSNSRGKKLEVEEPRRNVKLLKNKMYVIACNDSLNAKTLNVKSVSAMCAKCVMIHKHDLCVPKFVAKPLRKTVASESTKKPRNNVRKLNERFGKIYKWSYIKFTPSGYMWKPKSTKENVNPNTSKPLGNATRTANVKDTMTSRRSIVSNTPLSSNSFVAYRDCPIHRRL